MQNHDATMMQSVVYEMAQLGVKIIPFDGSKCLKDYMEMFPEHNHFVFSHRSIEEIADIYDKIVTWISPDRQVTDQDIADNISELNTLLEEKLISSERNDLISSALREKLQQSQQSRDTNV